MKLISNRKWTIQDPATADKIREWLVAKGGNQDAEVKNEHEAWRVRFSDATITFYKKGTLFITDSNDGALVEAHRFIESLVGSRFVSSTKDFLLGFDETGKGEVLGHVILVGAMFPKDLYSEIEGVVGVADTKVSHTLAYWDELFRKVDFFRSRGLQFFVEKIPPWHVDRYNINKLLDLTYQRILLSFAQRIDLHGCRIVLDDYGIGPSLNRYLKALEIGGAETIKTTKADDTYLESRLASLISKREQQKVLEAVKRNPEFALEGQDMGSGNAGDSKTVGWLKAWHGTSKAWPWFVKRSFKTVYEIEGKLTPPKKSIPPINDHLLSPEFRKKFESGELNIKTLSIVCPLCGATSKSAKLVPKAGVTTALCIACQRELPDLAFTLRYYCGRILPDSSVIARGFLSKDLQGARFFENFTFLLHPVVKTESDTSGGKKELERLGGFASIGRIKLEETGSLLDPKALGNIERDEAIQLASAEHNAILITADNGMKGSAQAKGLFVLGL
jgi:ribonuclease HII